MPSDTGILNRLIRNMEAAEVDPLRPMIDAYMLERVRSRTRVRVYEIDMMPRVRPGGRLSPSAIGGCLRQAAFKFLHAPGRHSIDPDREAIFDHGTWVHHKWQATFHDMEAVLGRDRFRVVSTEEDIEIPELYIAGSLDNVLSLERRKKVVDIKSINDNGFQWLLREQRPHPKHVDQLTTYMKGRRISNGILFYENKNNQLTKAFVVQFEQPVWGEIESWCEEVLWFLNEEQLPPMHPECTAGNYMYEKCPWAHLCYGTRTEVKVRKMVYKNFEGVEAEWEKGRQAVADAG